ncbi:MAG: alpha/beta hydrolase [Clostridia bacterium]|nr:alpha/beta hydrolase [Clostridia bacterium]
MSLISVAEIDGIIMPYAKIGNGKKAFVILPGVSLKKVTPNIEGVGNQYGALLEDYTIYLIDRRQNIPAGYDIEDMADDTAKVLKHLNIKNADIFGASQGGTMALILAAKYKDIVGKVVVGSTSMRVNPMFSDVASKWVELAKKCDSKNLANLIAETMFSENTLKKYKDVIVSSNLGATKEEYQNFILQIRACDGFDYTEMLKDITCPCFVLGCEGDTIFGSEESHYIADTLNCESYIYGAEYGHAVYDEAPDYVKRIKEFLSK